MAMLKGNPVVKKLVQQGEERVGKLATQLLASERFASTLQAVVQRTLGAKGFMDRNLRLALSAMNLPSTADVRSLQERLDELERLIVELDQKIDGLPRGSQPAPQARA